MQQHEQRLRIPWALEGLVAWDFGLLGTGSDGLVQGLCREVVGRFEFQAGKEASSQSTLMLLSRLLVLLHYTLGLLLVYCNLAASFFLTVCAYTPLPAAAMIVLMPIITHHCY